MPRPRPRLPPTNRQSITLSCPEAFSEAIVRSEYPLPLRSRLRKPSLHQSRRKHHRSRELSPIHARPVRRTPQQVSEGKQAPSRIVEESPSELSKHRLPQQSHSPPGQGNDRRYCSSSCRGTYQRRFGSCLQRRWNSIRRRHFLEQVSSQP